MSYGFMINGVNLAVNETRLLNAYMGGTYDGILGLVAPLPSIRHSNETSCFGPETS